ncbi:MAG: phosphoglucosamine mutase [Clostridia bacterium]|nr:phosphoglucosamine mutase [Clostridia bacterium]
MGKYFGTDGIRGIANTDLTNELAFKTGRAAALVLSEACAHKPLILIGKDTRISSDMLEAAMTAGFCSVGAGVVSLGVIPTPAVAYFVKKLSADAGVVISASHNSMEYNGIKLFNSEGRKLSDEIEAKIEAILDDKGFEFPAVSGADVGKVSVYADAKKEYVDFLMTAADGSLSGMKIAVDCANGSASGTAGELFGRLGADAYVFSNTPDGTNINDKCGSTHLEALKAVVKEGGYDVGVAFDGDADRVLMVDECGEEIDGDKIIAGLALDMKKNGTLKGNAAVVTIMTNMGFFKRMEADGIDVVKTKVGDRYVIEAMLEGGYNIGGEQSGHIILSDYNTTGDGELSALRWLLALKKQNIRASEFASVMKKFPQTIKNVRVTPEGKKAIDSDPDIQTVIAKVNDALGDTGRTVVRASGTEALIRVMLEGEDTDMIEKLANEIAGAIKDKYGA